MNKKILTLLASALVLLGTVFTANAQSALSAQKLSLGDTKVKLDAAGLEKYYHLRVDSISHTNAAKAWGIYNAALQLDSTTVLFLNDTTVDNVGRQYLYIDSINTVYRPEYLGGTVANPEGLNTVRSATSLWCVKVVYDIQGKNNVYDFTNKHSDNLLELDVTYPEKSEKGDTAYLPGGISGWHFSETYVTGVRERQPLYSYITKDTVAVLAVDTTIITGDIAGKGPLHVITKIIHVKDLAATSGILYFSLAKPKSFVLNKYDINSKFGTATVAGVQKFNFGDKDVDSEHTNPFADGIYADTLDWRNYAKNGISYRDSVSQRWLDSLGYLFVRENETGKFLYVDLAYYTEKGANKGDRYVKFAWRSFTQADPIPASSTDARKDSVLWPQQAFRFVYDPASDNIQINAYKATFWPEDYQTGEPTLVGVGTNLTQNWTDTTSQNWYSFYADTTTLNLSGTTTWWDTIAAPLVSKALTSVEAKPLAPAYIEMPWRVTQRLYVAIQDLNNATRLLTLQPNAVTNINFGIYSVCTQEPDADRPNVEPDLYLIRNAKGEYLRVPLYSATDSCEWEELDDTTSERPELLPSYQWIVQKRYSGAGAPITIVNREFPWLKFENIQLQKENSIFVFRNSASKYLWNTEKVNSKTVKLSELTDNDSASFVLIDKDEIRTDKHLGYTWIDPDESIVTLYALNYYHGYDADNYIGWDGDLRAYPGIDTTVYVRYKSSFTKMYFRFDTISSSGYGDLQPYGYDVESDSYIKETNIAQLVRQPYRLIYEDALKYRCLNNFSLTNGEQGEYAVTPRHIYKNELGKPVFYLRNTYFRGDDTYFALVQSIDTTTVFANGNLKDGFKAYLTKVYGATLAGYIIKKLDDQNLEKFNSGLFVAGVEDKSPNKLLATLRAEAQERISTFKLEADTDPIYRRFDNTALEGEGDGTERDAPKTVKFQRYEQTNRQLYENTGYADPETWSGPRAGYGQRNYLGEANMNAKEHIQLKTNTNIYVDTAYVNRGTGPIKPQYLLVVDPDKVEPGEVCDPKSGTQVKEGEGYLRGRFLLNAYDSAHIKINGVDVLDKKYLWDTQWERLIFVDAIHARDYLFILEGLSETVLAGLRYPGGTVYDLDKLEAAVKAGTVNAYKLGDNTHKDCVFSFRFVERNATDFVIESESTGHGKEPIIRPCEGGWIAIQNNVPVISRAVDAYGYYHDAMNEAAVFNVVPGEIGNATANEAVETPAQVTVIGDAGAVTIQGAAGKKVVITNVLGQTIVNTVLTSDNATIAAPKGIAVVSVEGEKSVKAIVK